MNIVSAETSRTQKIFTVYVQVRDLDRSLAFYRDGLGLEVDWQDDVLAMLRSPGDAGHSLVIREVGGDGQHHLGEAGVTRIAWQVPDQAELDSTEEMLSRRGVQYQRQQEAGADRITARDPDGLTVVVFQAHETAHSMHPPASLYWPR